MTKMKKFFIFMSVICLLIPIVYSDGGCVKVADDALVQLSMIPVAPAAKEKASMIFSFGNLSMNLINKPIQGRLYISENQKIVFEKNFSVNSGVLDLKYAFDEPGYYEIFVEFKTNGKKYAPEDFLIQVNKQGKNYVENIIFSIIGIIIGLLFTALIKIRRQKNLS